MVVQQCESEVIEFKDKREEVVDDLGEKKSGQYHLCKPPEP
jgi:hypothetical protein